MNPLAPSFVTDVVLEWVRLYTAAAPGDTGLARRAEIESDLWEHQRCAALAGEPEAATAVAMFGRFVRGIPADVSWRLQVRTEHRLERTGERRTVFIRGWALVALPLVLPVLRLIAGIGEDGADVRLYGAFWATTVDLVPPLAMVAGLVAACSGRSSHPFSPSLSPHSESDAP